MRPGGPTAPMTLFLLLVFVVAPLVELAVIVQVAGALGVLNTIGLMVLMSLLGAWLAKREGLGVLRRIQAALDRGDLPNREVADGGLILLAGALMIAPGFISDCLALLLLFPPTRALVRGPVLRLAAAPRPGRRDVPRRRHRHRLDRPLGFGRGGRRRRVGRRELGGAAPARSRPRRAGGRAVSERSERTMGTVRYSARRAERYRAARRVRQ